MNVVFFLYVLPILMKIDIMLTLYDLFQDKLPPYRSNFLQDPCTAPVGLPWPIKGFKRGPDPWALPGEEI